MKDINFEDIGILEKFPKININLSKKQLNLSRGLDQSMLLRASLLKNTKCRATTKAFMGFKLSCNLSTKKRQEQQNKIYSPFYSCLILNRPSLDCVPSLKVAPNGTFAPTTFSSFNICVTQYNRALLAYVEGKRDEVEFLECGSGGLDALKARFPRVPVSMSLTNITTNVQCRTAFSMLCSL